MNSKAYQVEDSLGYWVTLLARSLEGEFEQMLRPHKMTRIGYVILLGIKNGRCKSPVEIADYLRVDRAAVTRHLDRLEKLKLVSREVDKKDKRYNKVLITEKGKELLPKLIRASKSINKKMFQKLSLKEHEKFKNTVKGLVEEFEVPKKL